MFVQVIEVFIRSEEGLSRDMVKHLNSIEEQVLESKAWTRDSALWNALSNANHKVPTVEEVSIHTWPDFCLSLQALNDYSGRNSMLQTFLLKFCLDLNKW